MWNLIRDNLQFTGITDVTVWQDILFSSILIPIMIGIYKGVYDYWVRTRPLELLLKGFGEKKESVLVFLSQLHSCEDNGTAIHNQKYYILSPNPMPGIKNSMKVHLRKNIDPVWSEGDGECLADIFNVFGKSKNGENMRIADTIFDWNEWTKSTVSIGFNPKTEKLMEKCNPVHFRYQDGILSIPKAGATLSSHVPNDAGIIQRTYIENTGAPVLILAGSGTLGTSAAGYYFKKECVNLGKLYGSNPFCVLFGVKLDEGRSSVYPIAMYPKPNWVNSLFHPISYFKKRRFFCK